MDRRAAKTAKKILVVDDEAILCEFIGLALRAEGYEVVTAGNGREGLFLFESKRPDLVISDIIMPEMDGIEFIRNLFKRKSNTPVIVMSGNAVGTTFLRSARIFGARVSLVKPFSVQKLIDTVDRVIKEEESAASSLVNQRESGIHS